MWEGGGSATWAGVGDQHCAPTGINNVDAHGLLPPVSVLLTRSGWGGGGSGGEGGRGETADAGVVRMLIRASC